MSDLRSASRPASRLQAPRSSRASNTVVEAIVISSEDETEPGPPAKRQKTSLAGPSNAKRKYLGTEPDAFRPRPYLLIDLTACEDLIEDTTDVVQPPNKKQRPGPLKNETRADPILILDSDDEIEESDSDYDNLHDGFNVGWSTSAANQDEISFDTDVDLTGEAVARLQLGHIDTQIPNTSYRLAPLSAPEAARRTREKEFRYKGSSSFRISIPRGPVYASYCGGRSRTGILKHRPRAFQSPLGGLKLLTKFRMADSSQSITQSSSKILVASSTPGGTLEIEEEDDYRVDPYNSGDTLALWTEETREEWFHAHRSFSPYRKYYDIKCARFDPTNSDIFVSTGRDCSIVIWKNMKPTNTNLQSLNTISSDNMLQDSQTRYMPVKQWGKGTYGGLCHDIIFRPQDRTDDPILFAAPCENGKIFLHSYAPEGSSFSLVHCLQISPRSSHAAGATVWGRRTTSKMLFVCCEADNAIHGAFDTITGRLLYSLDRHENGEEIALDPQGSTLALFTVHDKLRLHLYDVSRADNRRTASISLPPPSPQLSIDRAHEVGVVSWSPDGLLLAVGCNDDVAHVYDVRCLERGPVRSLEHKTRSSSLGGSLLDLPEEERTESKSSFGITTLSWTLETRFKTPNLGLLTGGGDHCISLWDIKTASQEPRVVAELNGHVGVAHFGDLSKGEKPLVAGDTDGHVYIYDFVERQLI